MRFLRTNAGWINARFIVLISPEREGQHMVTFQIGGSVDNTVASVSAVKNMNDGEDLR